jgi:hypothetical protein
VNKLISIFNCTSHLNPCTFGMPEGNARTIASYSLVYHFLANREDIYFQCPSRGMSEVIGGEGGSLSLLSAVYKCAVYKCWNKAVRTVKEWFGKFQVKIPIEYLGMIGPEKFTLPFCPGCRGLHWISHTKLSECPWYAWGVSNSCVVLDETWIYTVSCQQFRIEYLFCWLIANQKWHKSCFVFWNSGLRLQDTLFGVLRKIATARSISVRFSSNFHQMFSSACKIW